MDNNDERRTAAIERLDEKRELKNHAVAYFAVNTLLVVIWAASGVGYFWPIWVIGGWGIGLVLHAWQVYGQRPFTESEIADEMHHLGPPGNRTTS